MCKTHAVAKDISGGKYYCFVYAISKRLNIGWKALDAGF
jgi:hypothetical protein